MRGVAVAPLATERWRFLGASAAQLPPFRALAVRWLSDEALLVIGVGTTSDEQPELAAAPVTTADGEEIPAAVGAAGGAAESATRLCLFVLRADLREVLFRSELEDSSGSRAPLWGCALLPAEPPGDTAAGSAARGSTELADHGCYGLPAEMIVVLGAARSLTVLALSIDAAKAVRLGRCGQGGAARAVWPEW